jgi:hypothetical protein
VTPGVNPSRSLAVTGLDPAIQKPRAVGREIDVDLVADAHGLDLHWMRAEADIGRARRGS